jgi:hypothetical protein
MTSSRPPRCRRVGLVDKHFAARISVSEERELRAHLADCASCRSRYERWLLLVELDRTMPSAAHRLGVGLGLVPTRPTLRGAALGLAPAAIAVALVGVASVLHPSTPDTSRAAGAPYLASISGGIEFAAYRADGSNSTLLQPHDEVVPRQPLGFAFAKAGTSKRMMILAVIESTRRAVWYEPSSPPPGTDPAAVPIENGDLVHEVAGGTLPAMHDEDVKLLAVFTNRDDLRASEVEAAVAAAPPGRIPALRGCELRAMPLHVGREREAQLE